MFIVKNPVMRRSLLSYLIFAALATIAIASVPVLLGYKEHLPFSQGFHGLTSDRLAPDFELTDTSGKSVRLSDIKGYRYVFFGFSRCTTVCPSTWAELRRLQAGFDEASAPKIVFISIDSEHDSPAELLRRFSGIGPNFIALTGSTDRIKSITTDYRILIPQSTAEAMHHSGTLYLVRPDGRIALIYLTLPDSKTLLADLKQLK